MPRRLPCGCSGGSCLPCATASSTHELGEERGRSQGPHEAHRHCEVETRRSSSLWSSPTGDLSSGQPSPVRDSADLCFSEVEDLVSSVLDGSKPQLSESGAAEPKALRRAPDRAMLEYVPTRDTYLHQLYQATHKCLCDMFLPRARAQGPRAEAQEALTEAVLQAFMRVCDEL